VDLIEQFSIIIGFKVKR